MLLQQSFCEKQEEKKASPESVPGDLMSTLQRQGAER
jgi:hypothetical protein